MKEVEKNLKAQAAQRHALFTEIEQHTKDLHTPFTKNLTEEEKKQDREARHQISKAYHKAATAAKKNPLPRTIQPMSQILKPLNSTLTANTAPFNSTWGFDAATFGTPPGGPVSWSASKNGTINLTADSKREDPFTGFANTYGGVCTVFSPPSSGAWTALVLGSYNCYAFINVNWYAGASSVGTCYFRMTAFKDGVFDSSKTAEVNSSLWNISSNPSFIGGNKVVPESGNSSALVLPMLQLQEGSTYVFWTWYAIENGNGVQAEAYGQLEATVDQFAFISF